MIIELTLALALFQDGAIGAPKAPQQRPVIKQKDFKPSPKAEIVISKEFVQEIANADLQAKLAAAELRIANYDLKEAEASVKRAKAIAQVADQRKSQMLKAEMIRLGVDEKDIPLYSGDTNPVTGVLTLKRKDSGK